MQGTALVIEDEAHVRRAVCNSLASEFERVLEAATASDGIDLAAASRPDLIVLDLGLPDQPGLAVCREIRKWSSAPSSCCPHIIRSARRSRSWMRATTSPSRSAPRSCRRAWARTRGRAPVWGLVIARQIVLAHGGLIGVDSGPGPGSVFSFTLPVPEEQTV